MARIKAGTTDPAQLLVPVILRDYAGARYTGSMSGGTITFTQPAGGATNTRALTSRGSGRYEMQLLAADVASVGNGWADVIPPAGNPWVDFCDDVEIYA